MVYINCYIVCLHSSRIMFLPWLLVKVIKCSSKVKKNLETRVALSNQLTCIIISPQGHFEGYTIMLIFTELYSYITSYHNHRPCTSVEY